MSSIYNIAVIIAVIIAVTVVTVVGDIFLKNATTTSGSKQITNLLLGVGIYILVAFGFVYMYKLMDLSIAGVLYAIITILLFVGVGAIVYGESISIVEWIGVGLAIVSVILLSRFA